MKFTARPASVDDLDAVALLEKKSVRPPWSKDAFAKELEKPHSQFWVLTDDETDSIVLGYLVFSFPAEQAHLQTFAISPEQKRQGHGTYLLRQMINFVMRNKGESIVLEVRKGNEAAIKLYQKLGFTVIHTMKSFYPDGEDGYSMIYMTDRSKIGLDFDSDDGVISERSNLN